MTAAPYAIAVCNGTAALHLAVHCLGLRPGDEVIVSTFTYITSVNTIAQTGARPVFADCRDADWLIDPADAEWRITPRTKAILPVHPYGAVCDMRALSDIAKAHSLAIVEDCAEALGSRLDGIHVGLFGKVGAFSFFSNKTVTTGEGGAVVTRDAALAARLRQVKRQGQSHTRRYWREMLGFNHRMTNIAAAIGVAQFEQLPEIAARKRSIARRCRELPAELPLTFPRPAPSVESSEWLISVLLPRGIDREWLIADPLAAGVETRPFFYCAHTMPMYSNGERRPVAEDIAARGISLPSFPQLTDDEIEQVVCALAAALRAQGFAEQQRIGPIGRTA